MIFVVEMMNDGTANIFRSAANHITHDEPGAMRAHYVFWSEAEAKQAHQHGAEIFAACGPDGYRAFEKFVAVLQEARVIPPPPSVGRGSRPRVKKKVRPY